MEIRLTRSNRIFLVRDNVQEFLWKCVGLCLDLLYIPRQSTLHDWCTPVDLFRIYFDGASCISTSTYHDGAPSFSLCVSSPRGFVSVQNRKRYFVRSCAPSKPRSGMWVFLLPNLYSFKGQIFIGFRCLHCSHVHQR